MNQGERIKTERERLGYNQTDFAALAGASKHSQINWEKGSAFPNSKVLQKWIECGLDALYVLTGQRNQSAVNASKVENFSPDKQELMEAFDELSPKQQKALIELGKVMAQPEPNKRTG